MIQIIPNNYQIITPWFADAGDLSRLGLIPRVPNSRWPMKAGVLCVRNSGLQLDDSETWIPSRWIMQIPAGAGAANPGFPEAPRVDHSESSEKPLLTLRLGFATGHPGLSGRGATVRPWRSATRLGPGCPARWRPRPWVSASHSAWGSGYLLSCSTGITFTVSPSGQRRSQPASAKLAGPRLGPASGRAGLAGPC